MSIEGKVALVTGAGSGIGRATAIKLSENGAHVAVADRNVSAVKKVEEDIRAAGQKALAIRVDVAEPVSVKEMVDQTVSTFGQLDILAHCAGISPRTPVLDMSDDQWHEVIGVNLDGTFYVARAAARYMVDQGAGKMILIASDRGTYGLSGGSHYSASKAGVVAFTKSLALELGPQGVTVNCINPGTTDTPLARGALTEEEWQRRWTQDPLGRLSVPEDIAEIILFLAGPGGNIMTGQLVTTRMRFG